MLSLRNEEKIAQSRNSKLFYKFVNTKIKATNRIGTIKNSNGEPCLTEVDKAEAFASFFKSVYKNCTESDMVCTPFTEAKLDYLDINSELVYRTLSRIPLRTSTSPDKIPYIFLKKAALGLTPVLTLLFFFFFMGKGFHRFLLHGEVPFVWLSSLVRPVFKKGCKADVKNYRPICLTCSTSKILERIVCKQLYDYLHKNNLITKH